ncbi:MAG: hypothetical protein LBT00_03405 [Spirochaetaceae bacterium]|nr:hypothetical protein [Spirochaetaceae bacterium]
MTGGDRHSESVAWPSLRTRRVKQSRRRRPSTGSLRFARNDGRNCRHCEEHGDEAIQTRKAPHWIASLRSQ